jgi:hypothetical protein
MTLEELLDVYDYRRESETRYIELCGLDYDYDVFDRVLSSSFLLIPFYSAKIMDIGAENKNSIRVVIDWDELNSRMHFYNREEEEQDD